MPSNKPPRQSKEQILADMARKKEVNRKKKLIVESFYPALVESTVSVDEAKGLISAMGSLLMNEVLKTMKERQFAEISKTLLTTLCGDGQKMEEVKKLLETLESENLFVAREIIEGMTRAIDTMIHEDMRERKLDTMKPDWDRYLN